MRNMNSDRKPGVLHFPSQSTSSRAAADGIAMTSFDFWTSPVRRWQKSANARTSLEGSNTSQPVPPLPPVQPFPLLSPPASLVEHLPRPPAARSVELHLQ